MMKYGEGKWLEGPETPKLKEVSECGEGRERSLSQEEG